jgi:sugar phosphate isomerase/epimerase
MVFESTKASLEFAENNSIGVCEVVLEPPEMFSSENQSKFIDLCNSYSIKKQVHGPFIDLKMCSIDPYISKASVEEYLESAKLCSQINSEILVIHPGSTYGGMKEQRYMKLTENVTSLLNSVSQLYPNVKICIENMPKRAYFFTHVQGISRFLDGLNRDDIHMTWDTSHSWTSDVDLEAFWEKFHRFIKNIHLADNGDKESDLHPSLGSANVNFREIIELIKKFDYTGALIVELGSNKDLLSSIEFVKNLL